MKKLLVRLLLLLAMIAPGAAVIGGAEAGAIYASHGFDCGFTPPAPNAVETCSKWLPSTAYSFGYSFKVDATHHYGWWGSNFDPGTWHIIVYLYLNGSLVGQQANIDVGDWAFPQAINYGNSSTHSRIYLWNAAIGGVSVYRPCVTSNTTSRTELDDTVGQAWAAGQMWPWGQDIQGNWCQHGFGSHGNWVRTAPMENAQSGAGTAWWHAVLQLN